MKEKLMILATIIAGVMGFMGPIFIYCYFKWKGLLVYSIIGFIILFLTFFVFKDPTMEVDEDY